MAKRLVVDEGKVYLVAGREEIASMVGVAHRGDYELLIRKGEVLAVYDDNGVFHFVDPVGGICFLRKECVRIIGPAAPGTIVEADKSRLYARRA